MEKDFPKEIKNIVKNLYYTIDNIGRSGDYVYMKINTF
jgi:hypothetical protein